MIALTLIGALLGQTPALDQPSPPPLAPAEPPPRIPRFVAPLLSGLSLAAVGVGAGFEVAAQDARSALRAPATGLTQLEARAAASRAQAYSQLALALFLSAAVIATSALLVAVLTQWAD